MNTLYLCGLEYDDYEYVGLDDYPFVRGMADDVHMVVATSRSSVRQQMMKRHNLDEYTHPMTIRKVCMIDLAPAILEWEDHEDLGKLAWETVTDLIIPYAGWCHPSFDYRAYPPTVYKLDDNGEPIECKACDGRGYIHCPDCNRTGHAVDGTPCQRCKGEGDYYCPVCEGAAYVTLNQDNTTEQSEGE